MNIDAKLSMIEQPHFIYRDHYLCVFSVSQYTADTIMNNDTAA